MSRIVAIRHGEHGEIDSYKTDAGEILTRVQAVALALAGKLDGVSAFTTRDGDQAIRSIRGQADYALSELPEF